MPKILIFDVECAPIQAFVWDLGKQWVRYHQVIHDKFILSWAAKWLFDNKIMSGVLKPEEARHKDDRRIVESMWALLDEADIIIAHNGKRFDIKLMNTRFILHEILPPMYYQVIDTLEKARSTFSFSSNALDYVNMLMELDGKRETNFQLWVDCYAGNKKALDKMVDYNKHDVVILEELYVRIRPWIKSHPNIGLYGNMEIEVCVTCGSSNLQSKGFYYTPAGRYDAFRCRNCGAPGRLRRSDLDKEQRKVLTA